MADPNRTPAANEGIEPVSICEFSNYVTDNISSNSLVNYKGKWWHIDRNINTKSKDSN